MKLHIHFIAAFLAAIGDVDVKTLIDGNTIFEEFKIL